MFIVEDGTGLKNANSYVSVEFADEYFSTRNIANWETYIPENKQKELIKATNYINYVFQWKGKKKTQEQSLAFPRTDLVDNDGYKVEGVPEVLKEAVCDATLELINGKSLYHTESENGNVTSEKIGELAFTYDTKSKIKDATFLESINSKLRGLYFDNISGRIVSGKVVRL